MFPLNITKVLGQAGRPSQPRLEFIPAYAARLNPNEYIFGHHKQLEHVNLWAGVLIWAWFGYQAVPQRKDPDIPVRLGVAACPWPGATA